jgi:hypothetical protein
MLGSLRARRATAALVIASAACTSAADDSVAASSGSGAGAADGGCAVGETALADGRCLPAGVQKNGCNAGEVGIEGGGCRAAGIPPQGCVSGFEADPELGCRAVLPTSCPAGLTAVPGQTTCHDVGDCGAAPYGDAPIEAATQYVDAAASGPSDGSAARPWRTIGDAVVAAAPNAIIAIAAGTYNEDIVIIKPLRLWGRCPSLVELHGMGMQSGAIVLGATADESQVHGVAVTGPSYGIAIDGAQHVTIDHVWVHPGDVGIVAIGSDLTVQDTLVEGAGTAGIVLDGTAAVVERSDVRATRPIASGYGWGVGVQASSDNRPSTLTMISSVVQDNLEAGIKVSSGSAVVEASVVRRTGPAGGVAIHTILDSTLKITDSTIEDNPGTGIAIVASQAEIERTTIRSAIPGAGFGASIEGYGSRRGSATLRDSAVRHGANAVQILGSDGFVESSLFRATGEASPAGASTLGILCRFEESTTEPCALSMRASRVEMSYGIGVQVQDSTATFEGTAVVGIKSPENGQYAFGVNVTKTIGVAPASVEMTACVIEKSAEYGFVASRGATATVTGTRFTGNGTELTPAAGVASSTTADSATVTELRLTSSVVEQSAGVGILVSGGAATVERTLVRETRAVDGVLGDGMSVDGSDRDAELTIESCQVEGNARAGISNFGASASVSRTTLECNPIQLDVEPIAGVGSFRDVGGNHCGCDGVEEACIVLSSTLEPPPPIIDGPQF